MSYRIKVCPECGHYGGHHSLGCPEAPDDDEQDEPAEVEPDDRDPDYDAPKAMSPLDNYARNHRRNVP